MVWECIQITTITLICGIGGGIFFSKLGELAMIKMLGGKADFHFTISVSSAKDTITVFLPYIFFSSKRSWCKTGKSTQTR